MGTRGIWEISVSSVQFAQFCCEPRMAQKSKIQYKNIFK